MTNFDLEKYKDGLPIIEPKNPFLDIPKVNINELDNYINHRVWIRSKTSYNYFEEHIYTLERIDMEKNKVFFQNNICIDFDDLIGIESLNVNYNEQIINFKQFVGKKVRITNKYNNFIDCALQAVYDEEIYFAVRLANYDSLSYDLSYPINLIKKIEIINDTNTKLNNILSQLYFFFITTSLTLNIIYLFLAYGNIFFIFCLICK